MKADNLLMATLLTIGEFSRMTHLSVKALRHSHDVGVLEPAAIDPEAIEPAAIEPAAIEPAAVEFTSAVSAASRFPGIEPYGTEAIPAGMDGSSAVSESELTAEFPTVTVTCCTARSLPSASACRSNW